MKAPAADSFKNVLGRLGSGQPNLASMAEYEIMINYRKSGTKYFPSFTKMVSRETSTNQNSGATQTVTSESYLLPLSTETLRPKLLDKRDYYSEVPFNKNFWESFTLAVE